jgi:hypothetical protein
MSDQDKGRSFGPHDYTGSSAEGGRPRTGAGSGGSDMPDARGGTRYGGESEGARQTVYFMEDPAWVRARGRMPRSYSRSDERVREDICERIAADPSIDASDVSVDVRDKRVVLEGSVPQRRMKYVIEDIAAACLRANDVENRVTVARSRQAAEMADAATSELGNLAGVSGTTGRPTGITSPPSLQTTTEHGGR